MTNGPMETGFDVYNDFLFYVSGVYKHVSGAYAGGHAVKIIGWGSLDAATSYWICANSWGTSWGESGYFRIVFNDCNIDSDVYACTPEVNSSTAFA